MPERGDEQVSAKLGRLEHLLSRNSGNSSTPRRGMTMRAGCAEASYHQRRGACSRIVEGRCQVVTGQIWSPASRHIVNVDPLSQAM